MTGFGGMATSHGARGGRWYLVVPLASLSLLAGLPFWHAYSRLRSKRLLWLAVLFTAAPIFAIALSAALDAGNDNQTGFLEALPGFIFIAVMIAAVMLLRGIRQDVYGRLGESLRQQRAVIAHVEGARARRAEARELAVKDPALARELGIGRPDQRRGYDDGGLVDVNSAPAPVIAGVCHIDPRVAEAIVDGRATRGGYYNVGELLLEVPMPPDAQHALRERGITFGSAS